MNSSILNFRLASKGLLIVFSIVVIFSMQQCGSPGKPASVDYSGKVLLAVFAHPDDETSVSPVLAHYASLGVTVYVAVATDGRYGATPHAHIPAGDSLALTRSGEMKCAAEKLGIRDPIMFGLHDQLKMQLGYSGVHGQLDTLRSKVKSLFEELKPDVVLTWNASGWSGHHDHRLVGAVVTEVFASQKWDKPSALYYEAIPTGHLPPEIPGFATVDSTYLPIRVSLTENDYAKGREALACHQSQYTPEAMDQLFGVLKASQKGTARFQSFVPVSVAKMDLFE